MLNDTGAEVKLDEDKPHETEELYHFLKVNLVEPLKVNVNYTLNIEYWSTMNEGPMKRGIWRGWYTDADGKERYVLNIFEPVQ